MYYCLLQLVAYQRMDQKDQPPPRVLLLLMVLHSCCCHLRHAGRNSQQVALVVMNCCYGDDYFHCYYYHQVQVNRHHHLVVVVVDAAMCWLLSVTPIICASIIVSFFLSFSFLPVLPVVCFGCAVFRNFLLLHSLHAALAYRRTL